MKQSNQNRLCLLTNRFAALLSIAALFAGNLAPAYSQTTERQSLSQDQRIIHVLNRLGFGARPGDVERIRAMGLNNYISQQLHPERIRDDSSDARVATLATLSMNTPELYAKYPQPGKVIKQLQQKGELPADLASVRQNKLKQAGQQETSGSASKSEGENGGQATSADGMAKTSDTAQNSDKKSYQKAVREYYIQNNLRLPQAIISELQASRIIRGVYSERQLQEVMVDFWENHFNVFSGKGADRWLLTSYDRDTIRPHTMGKFSDLLVATAESPAMLFYLDNFQSVSPNAQAGLGQRQRGRQGPALGQMRGRIGGGRGLGGMIVDRRQQTVSSGVPKPNGGKQQKRGINENYARELMELHTLGVDGGYTQKDVQEVARCFTGWTIYQPQAMGGNAGPDAGKFYFNSRMHDNGEKMVLGQKIPAGGGMRDGLMVLDILARNPSTAKFIATKLCRHFVMDNPGPALVARVSSAYTKSGGDISETLGSIFSSPEFNSPEAYRAKVKTPFELAVSAVRAVGGDTNGAPAIHQWIARMGQPLYGYQTPNGYADIAEAWVNTGSLLERINFGLALASNRIPGTRVDLGRFMGNSDAVGSSVDKQRVLDRFAGVILQGDLSQNTRATLLKQLNAQTGGSGSIAMGGTGESGTRRDRGAGVGRGGGVGIGREVARADSNPDQSDMTRIVGLIFGSPEFQRQ